MLTSKLNVLIQTAVCGVETCPQRHVCTVVDGLPQCTCHCCEAFCSKPGLVCASNGRTYHSYRDMNDKACKTRQDLTLSYWGPCQSLYRYIISLSIIQLTVLKICNIYRLSCANIHIALLMVLWKTTIFMEKYVTNFSKTYLFFKKTWFTTRSFVLFTC